MPCPLWIDCESYGTVSLKAVGAAQYARHPDTEVLLTTWAIADGPVRIWSPAEDGALPAELHTLLTDIAYQLRAHNAAFDRQVLAYALHRAGALTRAERDNLLQPQRWFCSMAQALSHALPPSLDELGLVLGLAADHVKIREGKKLIHRFCQPAPAHHKAQRYDHRSHPELWQRFKDYAVRDVTAMRECCRRMPDWNFRETDLALWHLDQQINDRGFYCDRALVDAGARAAEHERQRLAERFVALTQGHVARPSQRQQFRQYLAERFGLFLEDTQAETLRTVLRREGLDPILQELLTIAVDANKTSTSKYAALQPAIGRDGRFRGGLQFAGAGRTRRWAGRLYQPQNLPSRGLPAASTVDTYIQALKLDLHEYLFTDLMRLGSAALRGVITSEHGRIFAADLSNIEGRMLAWIAGENWKLQAFRDFDAGIGPDLYNITANMIIGVDPWKVPKKERNVFGKVPDLASGYQGGVAGYQNFARAYGVRMADHWDTICTHVDAVHIAKARQNLSKPWAQTQLAALQINELEWLASEACKLAWRARHPATVSFWYALQEAAALAIRTPGSVHRVTRLTLSCREHAGHHWLQILLPSGRRLCYFHPAITAEGSISYWGLASEEGSSSRAWVRCHTHGGKLTGNVCQTLAGDLLKDRMPFIERGGFPIVLTVHDEVVCDADAHHDPDELARLLATNPPWADGLPLAAAGFKATRYKKD